MERRFKVICSTTAASAFSDEERADIVRSVVPMAFERDRGVHEGLAFSFDQHGRVWQVVVDLAEGWVKIMTKEECQQAVQEEVRKN